MKVFLASLAGLMLLASPAVFASEALLQKGGCMGCHSQDKKLVGPAFKDIAAKYKGQGDAVAKLTDKVRKGGSGVWGPIPMPPNGADKLNDADLKSTIAWILKLS